MENTDQLGRITDVDTTPPKGQAQDPMAPQMPFPTSYKLNADQEQELITHALKRMEELSNENGRSRGAHRNWWHEGQESAEPLDPLNRDSINRTWLGKRRVFELTFENDLSFRPWTMGRENIYQQSNLTVPVSRRVCSQMIARAVGYFFGTDPWFAAFPVGEMDRNLAARCDRYARHKMDKSGLRRILEVGIDRAFVIGEAVIKSTWHKQVQYYKSNESVLVNGPGGDPIMDGTGDYITEDSIWIMPAGVPDPDNPGEIMPQTGKVLKRDMKTVMPVPAIYEERELTRRIVKYNNTKAAVVHYGDFLCPLTAASVQDADCVVHLYDRPVMEMVDEWRRDQQEGDIPEQDVESIRKSIEMIQDLAQSGTTTETAQNADRPGEDTQRQQTRSEPSANIAEFHLRYDADGDGIMEDIVLIIDVNTRRPIFYDYEANVTPDGQRPFSVLRTCEIPGRWYGQGAMEKFESNQNIVDLTINRWSLSQSRAGRIDIWNPQLTLEGQVNPQLQLNWGRTYTAANANTKIDEIIQSVYLTDNKGMDLKAFMELFMQMTMNESGVMNANDGQSAGLESSKLATGIRNIERSGQEMFGVYISALEPGIADALGQNIRLMMANLDRSEVFRYFEQGEGGEGAGTMVEIAAADIPTMDLDVQILLTRQRGEQVLAASAQATALVKDFYAQPYQIQIVVAQFYIDSLRALEVKNPDKIIIPTQVIDPMAQPGAAPGGPVAMKPSVASPPAKAPNQAAA